MKNRFFALLVALMMLLGMASASASATFPSPQDTGIDVLWLVVPWEDKGRDVLFGIQFNENRDLFGDASISIDILEQGTAAWNAQYARLDAAEKAMVDEDTLMLMDISIVDPSGAKIAAEGLNVTMYIQYASRKPEKDYHFDFVADGSDEAYAFTLIPCPYVSAPDPDEYYFSVTMNHFSPFALYMEAEPVTVPQPEASTPVTGDNSRLLLWGSLMVLAMGGMAFLSGSRSKKANG